jgi:hypothetical protein
VPVLVPFNLARACPTSDILKEVIVLSREVRLAAKNPICISGSTTFLGALNVIADLDFCEYYLLPADMAGDQLVTAGSKPELPLIWAKFNGRTYSATPTDLSEIGARFMTAPPTERTATPPAVSSIRKL